MQARAFLLVGLVVAVAGCGPVSPTALPASAVPTTTSIPPATAAPAQLTPIPTESPIRTDDLVAQVQAGLPAGAFDGIRAMGVAAPAEWSPLWVIYSYGMRNYNLVPLPSHFLALYTRSGAEWREVARVDLDNAAAPGGYAAGPDYLYEVVQTRLDRQRVWLEVNGGIGAHGGTYQLLAFDGTALQMYVSAAAASPGMVASRQDLDGDGWPEVVLNRTDYYVFCYACGLYRPAFQVLHWDAADARMVEVALQPLPAGQPQPLRDLVNRAVELAQAGLWKEAFATVAQATEQLAHYPDADAPAVNWDAALIRLHAEAHAEAVRQSPYPLLSDVFYGDYAAAVDLMRAYSPEEVFSPGTPLISGTAAAGYDVSNYITASATAALAVQPDLAAAYFLRGWAQYVADPGNVAARQDVERAAALAPGDTLFAQCAGYLRSLP